jgi:hypothetical protein
MKPAFVSITARAALLSGIVAAEPRALELHGS